MTNMSMASLASEPSAPSSTPPRQDTAHFSDGATRLSTPPSSSPGYPWEQSQQKRVNRVDDASLHSSPPRMTKNAFSILGKRKPSEHVESNAGPKKKPAKDVASSRNLVQMQISLGQEVQKTCAQCGMEYTASSAEDRKLHAKFHRQNVEGYDVGKDFVAKTAASRQFKGVNDDDAIVLLDSSDAWQRRRRGQAVLEIVQKELGAVDIPAEDLERGDRFRSYLYVRGTKCVGFVLVEKISEAFKTLPPEAKKKPPTQNPTGKMSALEALKAKRAASNDAMLEADSSKINVSTSKSFALFGISRIWTSPTHRGQGIAKRLLDTAFECPKLCHRSALAEIQNVETKRHEVKQHRLHLSPTKCEVAFSQPTDSGAKLARRWVGQPYGWAVYFD